MNIDERLQALTMNLELAFRDIQEIGVKIEQIGVKVDILTGHMSTLTVAMTDLARIVKDHEQRVNKLEGQ